MQMIRQNESLKAVRESNTLIKKSGVLFNSLTHTQDVYKNSRQIEITIFLNKIINENKTKPMI